MPAIVKVKRTEIILLLYGAAVVALGLWLVCISQGDSPARVSRVLTVAGSFLVAALLLQLNGEDRDYLLLPAVALITGIGVVFLWRLDPDLASRQIIWVLLGSSLMVLVYYLIDDVRDLARYKYVAGSVAIALMVAVMVWGQEKGGAQLWLGWEDFLSFQPGEFAKILMCIFLAGYAADKGDLLRSDADGESADDGTFRHLGPALLMVIFSLAIFVFLRDLGAAILFFGLFVAVSYMVTGRMRYSAVMGLLFLAGAIAAYYLFPHVARRMEAWLVPSNDPTGAGYQTLQILYGLAAGGVSGLGLGNGLPGQLPAAETDAIFAVVGEEIGLFGAVGVILLFVFVAFRTFAIGWQSRDVFGGILAATLGTVFSLQALVIIGGLLRIIPLTGITLPFVSYGGSSLVANFIALGLVLVVSRDCRPDIQYERRR
ncbi:MAG: FtsW/RodA/SpoVE family cell cycle protein [Armatimonadota bacterium]